jgi:hypothetical protein
LAQRLQRDSPPPSTKDVADCQSVVSSEPTETLLSEVRKEGNYVLLCKVNNFWFYMMLTEILYKQLLYLQVSIISGTGAAIYTVVVVAGWNGR